MKALLTCQNSLVNYNRERRDTEAYLIRDGAENAEHCAVVDALDVEVRQDCRGLAGLRAKRLETKYGGKEDGLGSRESPNAACLLRNGCRQLCTDGVGALRRVFSKGRDPRERANRTIV